MSNKLINTEAKCPFFISEAQKTITCEGIAGKETVTRFGDVSGKVGHEMKYCCENYSECPVNKAIMQKYTVILVTSGVCRKDA